MGSGGAFVADDGRAGCDATRNHEGVDDRGRGPMEDVGVPLDGAQEFALVEAMFGARQESGLKARWEGRARFEQFAGSGVGDRFAREGDEMQAGLGGKVTEILGVAHREAFGQQQEQVKNVVLMGLRMGESLSREPAGRQGADSARQAPLAGVWNG